MTNTNDKEKENCVEEIQLQPKTIYFISKHFFLFIFLLMTASASIYVQNKYIKLVVSIICLVLMFYVLLKYISIMICTKWTITDKSIIIQKGIIIKTTNETQLFRVVDFAEKQNILQNIFNNTDLYIYSFDKTDPELCIFGINKDKKMFDEIKRRVQVERELNHIRETTINANAL